MKLTIDNMRLLCREPYRIAPGYNFEYVGPDSGATWLDRDSGHEIRARFGPPKGNWATAVFDLYTRGGFLVKEGFHHPQDASFWLSKRDGG